MKKSDFHFKVSTQIIGAGWRFPEKSSEWPLSDFGRPASAWERFDWLVAPYRRAVGFVDETNIESEPWAVQARLVGLQRMTGKWATHTEFSGGEEWRYVLVPPEREDELRRIASHLWAPATAHLDLWEMWVNEEAPYPWETLNEEQRKWLCKRWHLPKGLETAARTPVGPHVDLNDLFQCPEEG